MNSGSAARRLGGSAPGGNRGFALITVLWVIVALATMAGASAALARTGTYTTRNRMLLARSEWAREACAHVLEARFASDSSFRVLDTLDLGRGTWCRGELVDPAATLDTSEGRGERRSGSGRVNPNLVSSATLSALPGLDGEAVESMLARQRSGRPFRSLDEWAGALSPSSRGIMFAAYQDLLGLIVFAPEQLIAEVEGGVRGTPITAAGAITFVPVGARLALIARESE